MPPTQIELGGDDVRVPGLEVHFGGDVHAKVAGRVHDIDWSHPQDGALEAELSASADGRELGRWLGDGATSGGTARFVGQLSGAVRAPRVMGQANFDDLTRELATLAGGHGQRERTDRDRWSQADGRAAHRCESETAAGSRLPDRRAPGG